MRPLSLLRKSRAEGMRASTATYLRFGDDDGHGHVCILERLSQTVTGASVRHALAAVTQRQRFASIAGMCRVKPVCLTATVFRICAPQGST